MREFNTMTKLSIAHEDGFTAGVAAWAKTNFPLTSAGDKDKNGAGGGDGGSKTGLVTKTRPKTKKPSLYKVLLLNDDYTPMEFVVHVLQKYFSKNREDAERIMLHVHQKGVGMCGVYTFEIAETKVTQVMDFSRSNNHPLQCTMEKE
jgi:ATP-dependent Clp protease adaptor protein ClpS